MADKSHSHPPECQTISPFPLPGPNQHDSAPLPGSTPNQAASPLVSPTLACTVTAPAPAPVCEPPSPMEYVWPLIQAPAPAPAPALAPSPPAATGDSSMQDNIPGLPDLILITNLQKPLEDGCNIVDPFIDPLSPPHNSSPPLHTPKTDIGCDIIDPIIDLSPQNNSSPLASADASKPKFKVG